PSSHVGRSQRETFRGLSTLAASFSRNLSADAVGRSSVASTSSGVRPTSACTAANNSSARSTSWYRNSRTGRSRSRTLRRLQALCAVRHAAVSAAKGGGIGDLGTEPGVLGIGDRVYRRRARHGFRLPDPRSPVYPIYPIS